MLRSNNHPSATRTNNKNAFTLVEILVVISIIGILLSLALPAIMNSIKETRRIECENNFRQVAQAMIGYSMKRDGLPGYCENYGIFAGGIDPSDPASFAGSVPKHIKVGSWHAAILGDLGYQPIYERWTYDRYPLLSDGRGDREATIEGYSTITAAHVKEFVCPSASGSLDRYGMNHVVAPTGFHAGSFPFTYNRPHGTTSTAHEVTFASSLSKANSVLNNQYRGTNPSVPSTLMPSMQRHRIEDFRDGASNTLLLTENHQAKPWHIVKFTNHNNHLTDIQMVDGKEVIDYPTASRYLHGCVFHFEDDQLFAGAPRVNPLHKINGGDVYHLTMNASNASDLARPSSLHTGGVNMAMADGSIRYVVESIDYRVYQSLMTPNGVSSDMPQHEYIVSEAF